MSNFKTTIAALAFAATAATTMAGTYGTIALTVPENGNSITLSASDFVDPIDIQRGSFTGEITWTILILNQEGFDIGGVALRVVPSLDETYALGEFEQIAFMPPSTSESHFINNGSLSRRRPRSADVARRESSTTRCTGTALFVGKDWIEASGLHIRH